MKELLGAVIRRRAEWTGKTSVEQKREAEHECVANLITSTIIVSSASGIAISAGAMYMFVYA